MRSRSFCVLAGLGLLAAACQPAATPPPPSAPTTAAAAPTQPLAAKPTSATELAAPTTPASLKASYSNPIATNLPAWVASEAGIFKAHGLDVSLENIASATGIPALLSGQVQLAQIGGSEALSAAAEGGDLAVIAITGPVYPFVFMAPGSIADIDGIKGKKIGVSNIGSSSDIATRVMLRKVGLDAEKDVSIVPVGSLQNRIAALLNGAIDGGVAQPPEQLTLEEKGFHVIYDLAAQKLPAASDAIVVQRMWLNTNRDVAQRYIDSIVEAIARDRKDRELAITVLQKYLKNDDQRALGVTYDFFVGQATPQYPVVRVEQFDDAVAALSATNEKIKTYDVSKMVDNSLVQSAMDRHVGGP